MPGMATVQRPGAKYTASDLSHAAADARTLMEQSPILQRLVALDILARRLFLVTRSAIDNEIAGGWDVTHPALVVQTLGMAAQERAVREKFSMLELQRGLLELAIPVMDILVQQEAADAQATAAQPTESAHVDRQCDPATDATDQSEPAILPGGNDVPPG